MASDCGRCGHPTIGRLCPRCQRLTRQHAVDSHGENPAHGDTPDDRSPHEPIDTADVRRELTSIARAHEQIDWDAVPSITAAEAAAWAARLEAARDDLASAEQSPIDRG